MEDLNPQQELFCQYYVLHEQTRGNATLSYAKAYGVHLEDLDSSNAIYKKDSLGRNSGLIMASSYQKAYDSCASMGSRLLGNIKIDSRIRTLLATVSDELVDAELMKVIQQGKELTPKVAAIREFNRVKGRILRRIDLTSNGGPLRTLSDEQLEAITTRSEEGTGA